MQSCGQAWRLLHHARSRIGRRFRKLNCIQKLSAHTICSAAQASHESCSRQDRLEVCDGDPGRHACCYGVSIFMFAASEWTVWSSIAILSRGLIAPRVSFPCQLIMLTMDCWTTILCHISVLIIIGADVGCCKNGVSLALHAGHYPRTN